MTAPTRDAGAPASIDTEHPWLGLSSYTEETREYFHGRDEEVAELARRVQRKNLTVLFGQSGLGKTSLLRAGLVPRLRSEGYCPVYVRIDYAPESPPPAEQIKQAIHKATAAVGDWTRPGTALAGESLWEFLHHRGDLLRDAGGRTLLPLLIFDQFEEIFTLAQADDRGRLRAREFLTDLADLVENRPPLALEQRLDQDEAAAEDYDFARADYRILIALREDYLAHLESLKGAMPSITQNRMRLARMTGAQALSAVVQPGGRLVSQEVAESIVRFVAGGSELANAEVEPSLLSLVCRELNNARIAQGRGEISADLLAGSRDTILAEFYERALVDQPAGVRRVLEDELLTESGYRESLAEERVVKALAAAGAAPDTLAKLVDRRLLRIEERLDVRRVELTHDVLCSVVRASRDLRHEREARDEAERQLLLQREREAETRHTLMKTRRIAVVSAVLMLIAIAGAAFGWVNYNRAHRADLAAQQARADAERLVGFLIEDFYAELAPTGRADTMGKLAQKALDYYDGLPPELLTPQTRIYRGMALIRVGGAALARDDIDTGIRTLREARAIFEQLRADGNDSEAVTLGLALALFTPYATWGSSGGPDSKPTDLPQAADLLRPLVGSGKASPQVRMLYADALNYLSHTQPKEQGVATCEEARTVLAGLGARELADLNAASIYADVTDSQARHTLALGRLDAAAVLAAEVYEMAEKVLAKRPGDLRSMRNRSLAADLLSRLASRRHDYVTAEAHARQAAQAGENYVRFNPTDLNAWVDWIRGKTLVFEVLMEQGRVNEARAELRSVVALEQHELAGVNLRPLLDMTWFRLAMIEAETGERAAAEKAFQEGARALDVTVNYSPEGSARRKVQPLMLDSWRSALLLINGDPARALEVASRTVERIRAVDVPADDRAAQELRSGILHGTLIGVIDPALVLGRYAEAETAAREQLALPANPSAGFDAEDAAAATRMAIAHALARQGRLEESRELVRPALERYRAEQQQGAVGVTFTTDFAYASFVSAISEADDAAGRARRDADLAEASRLLATLPAEARQLWRTRQVQRWIAEAREAAGR